MASTLSTQSDPISVEGGSLKNNKITNGKTTNMLAEQNIATIRTTGEGTSHDAWMTIENPLEGVQITFLETAEETGGARIVMRMIVKPGGGVAPEVHTKFTETYEVLEGTLTLEIGGKATTLTPGRTLSALPGIFHRVHNDTATPVVLRVVATPGSDAERGLRAYFGMVRDGLVTPTGMPKNLFIGALVLHQAGTYFPPLPIWISRIIFGALAVVGRWIGGEKAIALYYERPALKISF